MKLVAISPFGSATPEAILQKVNSFQVDLVVSPGYAVNMPSVEALQKVLQPGVHVFVEEQRHAQNGAAFQEKDFGKKLQSVPLLVSSSQIFTMPVQVFARRPTAAEVDKLCSVFEDRTFTIAGKKVSFLLCGEITAFNPDGSMKHGRVLPLSSGQVLVNPAHTVMGRWGVLGPKLENLSRYANVIHVANNSNSRPHLSTDVRVYAMGGNISQRTVDPGFAGAWCEVSLPPARSSGAPAPCR